MITFAGVFHHQLPVGIFNKDAFERNLRIFEIMRFGKSAHPRPKLVEFGWAVGKTDEHDTCHDFQRNRLQTMIRFVKIIRHAPGRKKRSVEIIGPAMIGTDQLGR